MKVKERAVVHEGHAPGDPDDEEAGAGALHTARPEVYDDVEVSSIPSPEAQGQNATVLSPGGQAFHEDGSLVDRGSSIDGDEERNGSSGQLRPQEDGKLNEASSLSHSDNSHDDIIDPNTTNTNANDMITSEIAQDSGGRVALVEPGENGSVLVITDNSVQESILLPSDKLGQLHPSILDEGSAASAQLQRQRHQHELQMQMQAKLHNNGEDRDDIEFRRETIAI